MSEAILEEYIPLGPTLEMPLDPMLEIIEKQNEILRLAARGARSKAKEDRIAFEIYRTLLSGTLTTEGAKYFADKLLQHASHCDYLRDPDSGITVGADAAANEFRVASYFLSGEAEGKAVNGYIEAVGCLQLEERISLLTQAVADFDKECLSGSRPGSMLAQRARACLSACAEQAKKEGK